MKEVIPRTAWNVYEKPDKDTWQLFPRKKKFTTFVNIMELTISDEEEDPNFDFTLEDALKSIERENSRLLKEAENLIH